MTAGILVSVPTLVSFATLANKLSAKNPSNKLLVHCIEKESTYFCSAYKPCTPCNSIYSNATNFFFLTLKSFHLALSSSENSFLRGQTEPVPLPCSKYTHTQASQRQKSEVISSDPSLFCPHFPVPSPLLHPPAVLIFLSSPFLFSIDFSFFFYSQSNNPLPKIEN